MKKLQQKNLFFTLVLAVSLVLYSCKKDTNSPPPVANKATFTSLKKGHRWVYSFKYNGIEYDSLIVQVTDEQNGVLEVLTFDKTSSQTDYRYAEGDYVKVYPKGKTAVYAQRVAKLNAILGETWKDFTGTDTIQTTVKETGLKLEVPAGTYYCQELEVKNLHQKTTQYNYTNNSVGLVKILIYPNTGGTVVYELKYKNF